jgi:hypothetical protein
MEARLLQQTFISLLTELESLVVPAECSKDFVAFFHLPRLAPSQAPQSAHREDDGDERGHAERDDRPDEEEGSAGLGDFAADILPRHVEDGDDQPKERPEEYYDLPRSPFSEHKRSVKPNDKDGHCS